MTEAQSRTNLALAVFHRFERVFAVGAEFPNFDDQGPFVLAVLDHEQDASPSILAEFRYKDGDLHTTWAFDERIGFASHQESADVVQIVRAVAAAVVDFRPVDPALRLHWNTSIELTRPRPDGANDVIRFGRDGPRRIKT